MKSDSFLVILIGTISDKKVLFLISIVLSMLKDSIIVADTISDPLHLILACVLAKIISAKTKLTLNSTKKKQYF